MGTVKLERPLVVLDIESTGLDVVKDRIIELGMMTLMRNGNRGHWVRRFNPGMPIPAEATAVHGLTDEDVRNEPAFEKEAAGLVAYLKGCDLAGYNLWKLDLPILDEELRRCGLKLDLAGVRVIDAFGIFAKKEPRKLEDAVKRYCGRSHEGAHGALADAAATLDVLQGQLAEYADLAELDMGKLADWSRNSDLDWADLGRKLYRDKDGDLVYAIGKARGTKLVDDPGFGEWMLSKDFPGSTKDALRAEFKRLWPSDQSAIGTW